MSQSEIAEARQLIRPILASQLSLCKAVYPPAHPDAGIIEGVERAIKAFDRLVTLASTQSTEKQLDVQN